jgi:hypothetical protein
MNDIVLYILVSIGIAIVLNIAFVYWIVKDWWKEE